MQKAKKAAASPGEGAPSEQAELRRLRAEFKRVSKDRDIPQKGRRVLCQGVRAKYALLRAHAREFRLSAMYRALGMHRSGYYPWLRDPAGMREREDERLLGLIKHYWLASGTNYGYRRITLDLRNAGETCSRHRVRRPMKAEGLLAPAGHGSKPKYKGGPTGLVENVLNREFAPNAPNEVWATDITYIQTYEGWLLLAAVMDLSSRQIVGWSMQPTMTSDMVLQALLAAVWRREPAPGVMVHRTKAASSSAATGRCSSRCTGWCRA